MQTLVGLGYCTTLGRTSILNPHDPKFSFQQHSQHFTTDHEDILSPISFCKSNSFLRTWYGDRGEEVAGFQ